MCCRCVADVLQSDVVADVLSPTTSMAISMDKYRSILQNIVSFIGFFCKRDDIVMTVVADVLQSLWVLFLLFLTVTVWFGYD